MVTVVDASSNSTQQSPDAAAPPPSSASSSSGKTSSVEIQHLLKRRLLAITETIDHVDRAALYLRRRDAETGILEFTPGCVVPEEEEKWMTDCLPIISKGAKRVEMHLIDDEEDGPEPTWLLEGGSLAIHINAGPRIVAVLLVDDGRKASTSTEGNQSTSGWTPEERAQVLDVSSRTLGTALMDTLITGQNDAVELAEELRFQMNLIDPNESPSASDEGDEEPELPPEPLWHEQKEAVEKLIDRGIIAGIPVFNPEKAVENITVVGDGALSDEEILALAKAAAATAEEEDLKARANVATTSFAFGSRNVTLDIHLVEEFQHLIDDSLKSAENNTNILILKIAVPVVAAMAFEPLISLVDTYYVGQYLGSVSLSAYGLSERVFVFGFYVLNFLATSTTPIVANLRAQGEEEAARELVGRLLFFAAVFGIALIPFLQSVCFPLLNILGAVPENLEEAVEYFQVRSWGAPAVTIVAVANGALRGYLDTATPLIVATVAFIVDYSVDPELIYPQDPKSLGAAGAATVIAEWLSAGMFLTKFLTMNPPILPIFDFFPPWAEMAPVVQASAQIFVRTVLLQSLLAISCAAAARIGPLDIAAHQVALQLWVPPSFLIDAFAVAAQGLVADAVGRKDRQRARELGQLLVKYGVAMGGFLAIMYAALELADPDLLPRLFTEDAGIVDKVTPIIWIIAIMQPINGVVNVGAGILQGALDFRYQVVTMGISAVIAAGLFFVVRDEGLTAVWETLLAFQVIRAVLFGYRFLEPTGPLAVTGRREPRILMGYSFGDDWDKNKGNRRWRKKARKKF